MPLSKQQIEMDSSKSISQPIKANTSPMASVAVNGDQHNVSRNGHPAQRQLYQTRRPQSTGRPLMIGGTSTQQYQQQHHHHSNNPSSTKHSTSSSHPTPLFERLVTEEVQELKTYQRMVENQSRRLQDLERIHGDLEKRLEIESRGKAQLEAVLEHREREWALKFRGLQEDRDHWKSEVVKEKEKNTKLFDQVMRKDQDIHRMLQRKV
jgi:hypothetical protein